MTTWHGQVLEKLKILEAKLQDLNKIAGNAETIKSLSILEQLLLYYQRITLSIYRDILTQHLKDDEVN